jgi:Protein of unknown function (DUF1761)
MMLGVCRPKFRRVNIAVDQCARRPARREPEPPGSIALGHGLLAGACFVGTSLGINYQFANRSPLVWVIDGGYHTVQFVLFGLVLGLCYRAVDPGQSASGSVTVPSRCQSGSS